MNVFVFDNAVSEEYHATFVNVPPGIRSKDVLLKRIAELLIFPGYYGENWDAFEECIRDLSWLPDGIVYVRHHDVPIENDVVNLRIYVSILQDAVLKFQGSNNERRLLVQFPTYSRSIINKALEFKAG